MYVVDGDPLALGSIMAIVRSADWTAIPHLDAAGFLARLRRNYFGCVLMDLSMPGVKGTSLLRELNSDHPELSVIMMSGHADVESATEALRCGALDVLIKPFRRRELLDRVAWGMEFAKVEHVNQDRVREIRLRVDSLTPREHEVMGLLRQGVSVKRTGFELGVSHKTIQVHRARILRAMRVDSVVELANLLHEMDSLRAPFRRLATTKDHGRPRHGVAPV